MQRREFLTTVAAGAAGLAWQGARVWTRTAQAASDANRPVLKGFIVSDAHFGWENAEQPAPEVQVEMMRRIMSRFPDLDLFIDTGDAHHNGRDRDPDRGRWTEIIANGCQAVPFYYVPGNHEICHAQDDDPEWRCCRLGSLECRPYYSFDCKNIHFISIPEMVRAVYINRETLEWVQLDLEAHRDQTTILLSHNNIRGTTEDQGQDGYRGLVHSERILDLMRAYPKTVAWMHGHNHTYEVVEKHDRLFVSNGRIGGFNPTGWDGEYGQGNLGGVYFEVTPAGVTTACYSAEKEKFLDEMGFKTRFTRTLQTATSLDPTAPPAYCYGFGGARDGQRTPVVHHHAGGSAELILGGIADAVFNDDPEFELYTARQTPRGPQPMLMGSDVSGRNNYVWHDPGLEIIAQPQPDDIITVSLPRPGHADLTYFRCAPGKRYRVSLDVSTPEGGPIIDMTVWAHDRDGRALAELTSPQWTLSAGRQQHSFEVALPADMPGTIYADPASDLVVHAAVELKLTRLRRPVVLHAVRLALADAAGVTLNPTVRVGEQTLRHEGPLAAGAVARIPMAAPTAMRSVFEVAAGGSGRVNWIVRHRGPRWQVRNAPVADRGDHLAVGPLRNPWTSTEEIIIAPVTATQDPFVHRLAHVRGARVYPFNSGTRQLQIEVDQVSGPARVVIVAARAPQQVRGAQAHRYQDGRLELDVAANASVVVSFA